MPAHCPEPPESFYYHTFTRTFNNAINILIVLLKVESELSITTNFTFNVNKADFLAPLLSSLPSPLPHSC